MGKTSTAQVAALLVLEACDRYLAHRKQIIDNKVELHIMEEMAKPIGFINYLRGRSRETREEILARSKGVVQGYKWEGGYWANKVRALQTLAKVALNQVGIGYLVLTTDDAELLRGYWE